MSRRFAWSALFVLIASLAAATALAASPDDAYPANVDATLGPRHVTLPVPAGFGTPDQTPEKLAGLLRRNLPANQHFLGILMDTGELAEFETGRLPRMERYFMLTSATGAEPNGMGAMEFASFKDFIRRSGQEGVERSRKSQANIFEKMDKEVREISGNQEYKTNVKMGAALGVFLDEKDAIAMATSASVEMSSTPGEQARPVIAASGFVRLHGRLVSFIAYTRFRTRSDLDWAEGQVRGWIGRAAELNPPDAQDTAPPPGHVDALFDGHTFHLPVLPGFADPATTSELTFKATASALPPASLLLSMMQYDDSQHAADDGHGSESSGRFVLVQALDDPAARPVSTATFLALKKILRDRSGPLQAKLKREIGGEMAKASTRVGKTVDDDSFQVHSEDFSVLGVFDETPDSISFAGLQTITVQSSEGAISQRQAMASCSIRVHGNVLAAAAYSRYASPADVEWVKAQMREWARRMRELNP